MKQTMTPEKLAEIREGYLRRDYESVRADHPEANLPAWENLTADQRAAHKRSYDERNAFFQDLGAAIQSGGPLPKIS